MDFKFNHKNANACGYEVSRFSGQQGLPQAIADRTSDSWRYRMLTRRSFFSRALGGLSLFMMNRLFAKVQIEKVNIKSFGAAGDGVTNDSVALTKAIHQISKLPGAAVYFPKGRYLVAGDSIVLDGGANLSMVGNGDATLLIDCNGCTTVTDMQLNAPTLFIIEGTSGKTGSGATISIRGLNFKAVKATGGRIVSARSYLDKVVIRDNHFHGFSSVGVLGFTKLADGVHPGSDAESVGSDISITNNFVESDSVNTEQEGKFLHLVCLSRVRFSGNKIVGHGGGYLFRASGGSYDTIPRPGHGATDIIIRGNKFVTDGAISEYNQIAKATDIVISDNIGDASRAPNPHNLFDCFNCLNVEFNDNVATGGGLLFFGHADLNHSAYGNELVPSNGCTARRNLCINPTHISVFNIGGDGTPDGRRATRNVLLEDNEVRILGNRSKVTKEQAFLYTFVTNGLVVKSNSCLGLDYFWRSFYDINIIFMENEMGGMKGLTKDAGNSGYLSIKNSSENKTALRDFNMDSKYYFDASIDNKKGLIELVTEYDGEDRIYSADIIDGGVQRNIFSRPDHRLKASDFRTDKYILVRGK